MKITIHDLAFGGEGVGRHEGAAVFVSFAAVGDEVDVKIVEKKKSFLRAEIVEIVKASQTREKAPCPYYGICGGCQYQHITYQAELSAKEKQLRDTLARVGKISDPVIRQIIACPAPYGYRNRITVHNERGKMGFRATNNRDLVDVEKCLLATDEVNEKLKKLRERPRPRPHYSVRGDAVAGEAFHQTNALLTSSLQKLVCDALDSKIQAIVEGYAGVGFFTEPLSGKVEKIIAIESDEKAVSFRSGHDRVCSGSSHHIHRSCECDAITPRAKNIQWICGTCEEHLASAARELNNFNAACLVDPPREGLSKIVAQDLFHSSFEQILYLSCNPSTLARDLQILSPKWKAEYFQPIDIFPRTAHLECLVVLRK
ncbi:MAG: class I SAM-dependent RNA methyltransferase [Verrucomicrobiota bacterium]